MFAGETLNQLAKQKSLFYSPTYVFHRSSIETIKMPFYFKNCYFILKKGGKFSLAFKESKWYKSTFNSFKVEV